MQKLAAAHDTESRAKLVSMNSGALQVFPLKTSALPKLSTAAQNTDEAHEIVGEPIPPALGSTRVGAFQLAPSYVTSLPNLSMAAQKLAVGHETDVGSACGASGTVPVDQGDDDTTCALSVGGTVRAAAGWAQRPDAPKIT